MRLYKISVRLLQDFFWGWKVFGMTVMNFTDPSSIEHIFMIPPFQCYVFSDPLLPVVFYETLSRGQYFYDRLSILHV